MTSSTEIRVPRETVNDDFVTIVEWHAATGDRISAGQVVVAVETSKAVLEVEAEADGYLEILQPVKSDVAVGEVIGRIGAEPPSATAGYATPPAVERAAATAPGGATISRKAQALIDEHGIDPAVFEGAGLVRAADVIRHLEQRVEAKEVRETSPAAPLPPRRKLGLLGDARVSAGERGTGLISLVWGYLWRNWFLGHMARWAPRGLDLFIHRLRGVKMGKDCFIDPSAIVETAYPENITLGNDVRITAGSVIMTHIKAPHYLRDTGLMPLVLKPVVIEDHCFIGLNAVIIPGVRIGRAAVVASGAVVVSNVPAYSMVAGNPAKVIKRFPRPEEDGAGGKDRG